MDGRSKFVDYYKNNKEFIDNTFRNNEDNKIIFGHDNTIVQITYKGVVKTITLDEFIQIKSVEDLEKALGFIQETPVVNTEVIKEPIVAEEVIPKNEPVTNALSSEAEELDASVETLYDIKSMAEMKNKVALDNILKKFAINETTGLIDFNKGLDIIENNTLNEVVSSINENRDFDRNPINYDSTGKYIGTILTNTTQISQEEKIMTSFNNVRIYLDAAKMYPEQVNFTDNDIDVKRGNYIAKVKNILNGKQNTESAVVTPINSEERLEKTAPVPTVDPNIKKLSMRPVENKSAGFADIFVLSIIVLVYAIIIVNLIMKLS